MWRRRWFAGVAFFSLWAALSVPPGGAPRVCAGGPPEPIRLALEKVSAQRSETGVVFRCEAVLTNDTGTVVNVRSTYYSAFDGVELVVLDAEGKRLAQQRHTLYQSPYSPDGRPFPLLKGANRRTLIFPVRGLPADLKTVRVMLVGTLPGNDQFGVYCSDLRTVTVPSP